MSDKFAHSLDRLSRASLASGSGARFDARMVLHRYDSQTLARAPELATLSALEKVLFLMTRVLIAEHPTLAHFDPLAPRTEPRTLREARRILRHSAALRQVLRLYRRAALDALKPPPAEELPF